MFKFKKKKHCMQEFSLYLHLLYLLFDTVDWLEQVPGTSAGQVFDPSFVAISQPSRDLARHLSFAWPGTQLPSAHLQLMSSIQPACS